MIVWDIEANGLWPDVDKLWCLSICEEGETELYTNYDPSKKSIEDGVNRLNSSDGWANHNIWGYDIPVMKHLGYELITPSVVVDTLIVSRVLYPSIELNEFKGRPPNKLIRSHSLKAWGHRLDEHKGEFNEFDRYSNEMGVYNIQDSYLNYLLLQHLKGRAAEIKIPWVFNEVPNALSVEHEFKRLIEQQKVTGFYFDVDKAWELKQKLEIRQCEINDSLQSTFPPITEQIEYVTAKKKERKTKTVTTVFNPASRKQIGERLTSLGWKPSSFTGTGLPTINDDTIAEAAETVPEAAVLSEYFLINKRLGALCNGKNSWMRLSRDGVIHGSVNTMGAVTTRVTHNLPNMSQVPSVRKPYGKECRSLFIPRKGWSLIGADLSGIELRCLAHYLWPWDDGEYASYVLDGDVHTVHQKAFGLPYGDDKDENKKWRGIGKGGTYCLIYGGGDWKLGWTLGARGTEKEVSSKGKKFRASLMSSLPALKHLTEAVKRKQAKGSIAGKNTIRSINGHPLYCRSPHSALNTLLQSAGAQVAKTWYIQFHYTMAKRGYIYGRDYETHGFFHDEIQAGSPTHLADTVGQILLESAEQAGNIVGFRLPVEAEFTIGDNWNDTH